MRALIFLTFIIFSYSCSQPQKPKMFEFKKIALSQGKYFVTGELSNLEGRTRVTCVLNYYNLPYEVTDEMKIIVNLPSIDTNLMYNVFKKSQDRTWFEENVVKSIE